MKGVSLFSNRNNVLVNVNEEYIYVSNIISKDLLSIFFFLNLLFPLF